MHDLQKLDADTWHRVNALLSENDADLRSLTRLSGLNPTTDFRRANFAGISLANQDITGFDFSDADLRGCEIRKTIRDETTILNGAILDQRDNEELIGDRATPQAQNLIEADADADFAQAEPEKPLEILVGRSSSRRFDDLF